MRLEQPQIVKDRHTQQDRAEKIDRIHSILGLCWMDPQANVSYFISSNMAAALTCHDRGLNVNNVKCVLRGADAFCESFSVE